MKERLLDLLACPECTGAPLELDVFSTDGGAEIEAGRLTCPACRRHYPIIDGVPRLLPDVLIGALLRYHPTFFRRWDVPLPGQGQEDEVARTLAFYSVARAELYAPQPASDLVAYWRQSLHTRIPESPGFAGKLGLDAGCGEGRYTYCLAEGGAEVIGLDLSEAVRLAHLRNRANPRAHIVQGSIYQPPVRRETLDFVISTGVLHHLPDPQAGFASLVPLLRPGGSIHVWVYGLRHMNPIYRLSHLSALHRLARGLSPRASYLLSLPIALALELLLFKPVHLLARRASLGERIPVQLRELASLPFQMHLAEVHDRIGVPVTHYLTDDDLRRWYGEARLEGVAIQATHGGRGWSARGAAPVDAPVSSQPA